MLTAEAADKFIYDLLNVSGVTSLLASPPTGVAASIYNPVAPQGVSGDVVVFRVLTPQADEYGQNQRQLSAYDYLVFAATQGGEYPYAIDAAMDTALQDKTVIVGGFVCHSLRVSGYSAYETIDGRREARLGGRYRVRLEHPL